MRMNCGRGGVGGDVEESGGGNFGAGIGVRVGKERQLSELENEHGAHFSGFWDSHIDS